MIPFASADDGEPAGRLQEFRDRVLDSERHAVDSWAPVSELRPQLALTVPAVIHSAPRPGRVRGGSVSEAGGGEGRHLDVVGWGDDTPPRRPS